MVDKELVENRLHRLEHILRKLNKISKTEKNEFTNNEGLQDQAERNLQLAAQICIDIGNHIISDEGFRSPAGYGEIFQVLKEEGIIDEDLAETMRKIAGFRNILVHDYLKVDINIVYSTLQRLEDFKTFAKEIGEFIYEDNI
ncbi:type VII toxin-antitoxin system HepT family RNase toxin [Natranaerofaba carboxydovora]|uniref:type VII toxin-antitoxin system HepT family RNase toxin n=1 Tax=Natranaerofaba carboxydovora TaxID=2742683 RepID=UPI001F14817B|nr:DUF86 domain-containing protein [Natranaerofaba carboxydovora]UMZ74974.1 hypothetical protein ACONDI_02580 [Natranaerofaba carboxydovora]